MYIQINRCTIPVILSSPGRCIFSHPASVRSLGCVVRRFRGRCVGSVPDCLHACIIHTLLQVNYLIDEAVNTGKGANNIISMLHHFLQTHKMGEVNLHVHCDNNSGQKKKRFVMQHLCWRVMAGLNRSITVSFLIHKIFARLVLWSF